MDRSIHQGANPRGRSGHAMLVQLLSKHRKVFRRPLLQRCFSPEASDVPPTKVTGLRA